MPNRNYTLRWRPGARPAGGIIRRHYAPNGLLGGDPAMRRPAPVVRWDSLPLEKVTEMVARKTVRGTNLTLTQSYLKKGALVPRHAHAGEQMLYVLQGAICAGVDGRDVMVREGEVLQVPAGALHQAEALDDTFILDVCVEPAEARRPEEEVS